MEKKQWNQDELYEFLKSQNLTIKRLGEMIGQSDTAMSNALKHNMVNGKPLYFNEEKLQRINEALPRMADEIEARLMEFHPENTPKDVKFGREYDPSCVEQLRRVGDYFNIEKLTNRVLGWSKSKKDSVCSPKNPNHGRIKESDVMAINLALIGVAGMLRRIEVVPM